MKNSVKKYRKLGVNKNPSQALPYYFVLLLTVDILYIIFGTFHRSLAKQSITVCTLEKKRTTQKHYSNDALANFASQQYTVF